MTAIKICGVTRADDAARIAAAGIDLIGLNFWPRSKRYLEPTLAPAIATAARDAGEVRLVGVFVDPTLDEILAVATELDVIQLHGDEDVAFVARVAAATRRPVWKALSVESTVEIDALRVWPVDAILLDAPDARSRHARPEPGQGPVVDRASCSRPVAWAFAGEAGRQYPARKFVLAGGLDPISVHLAIAVANPWCVDVASGVESAPGIKDPAKIAAFVAAVRAAG